MTWRDIFKQGRRKRLLRDDVDMEAVFNCVNSKEFSEFLKYLALTVDEKNDIITTMNLFEQKSVNEAIKIQYMMRGILLVQDLAQALISSSLENERKGRLTNVNN